MTNSRVIPASPAAVWTALNDPSILQASIPGCESLERIGDNEWRAVVAAKVGPVSAKFSGTMRMIDPTPPTGYTLQFTGQGGAAGFASGEARVTLTPAHLAVLAKAFPPDVASGTRYAAEQMAHLDSEKPATA